MKTQQDELWYNGESFYETSKLVNPQKASYKLIYKLYWKPGKQASITNSKSGTFTLIQRGVC